ncbi:MAG UNVERIFIED_CONTAM: hypothetical protein LVR18_30355 [Planctomycetaceae bacterium]
MKIGWLLINFSVSHSIFVRSCMKKHPTASSAQRALSISLGRCGDVALKREDLVAADQFFRESLRIDRKLHEKAPDSEQAQRDLSISLGRCGDVALKREDLVAADQFFRESLRIDRKLHEKAPDSEQRRET